MKVHGISFKFDALCFSHLQTSKYCTHADQYMGKFWIPTSFSSWSHTDHGPYPCVVEDGIMERSILDPESARSAIVYIRKANWDHPDGPRILARADAKVIRFRVTLPDEILTLPVYQWWTSARNNACMRYLGHFYQDQLGRTRRDIPGVLRGVR